LAILDPAMLVSPYISQVEVAADALST